MSDLPDGWDMSALGDFCSVVRGISYKASELAEPTLGRPMVNLRSVGKGGGYRPEGVKFFTGSVKDEQVLEPGDLLVAMTDLSKAKDVLGSPIVIPHDLAGSRATFSLDLSKVVPDETVVDRRFISLFLQSPSARTHMKANGRGITVTHLRTKALPELVVPLPPLDEQRRIVTILEDHLSRLDAALGSIANVAHRAEQLAVSVLSDRLDGATEERRTVGELLSEGMRNGHSARATSDGTGIRTLTLTAVTAREFTEANTKLTVADPARVRDLWLQSGDILVERSNTPELVGTAAIYEGPSGWAIFPDLLIRLRANEALVVPKYLELALQSPASRRYLKERAKGLAGSMPKIDQGTLAALPVPVPSLAEQARTVAQVEALTAHCSRVLRSVAVTRTRGNALRRALLTAAFSGQLTKEPIGV